MDKLEITLKYGKEGLEEELLLDHLATSRARDIGAAAARNHTLGLIICGALEAGADSEILISELKLSGKVEEAQTLFQTLPGVRSLVQRTLRVHDLPRSMDRD